MFVASPCRKHAMQEIPKSARIGQRRFFTRTTQPTDTTQVSSWTQKNLGSLIRR
jgi:hypothetical protein